MANHDIQVILRHESLLPEDVYVNTLHFDVNAPDTLGGTCDDIAAAYTAQLSLFAGQINGMTIKAYPPGPNPSGPEFQKDYPFDASGNNSPAEVCCCLSYATVDDPEQSVPRRRGRIYVGPVAGSQLSGNERPTQFMRDSLLSLGQGIASAGNASNSTWLHYSKRDNAYTKIESIWVDDAWDTQRRRGLAPTLRQVADVQ